MSRAHNSIRSWALLAVVVTSAALIYFGWKLIGLLSEPTWCNRAIGAAEAAEARPESAVAGCFRLLEQQVDALALNSHFVLGTLALCLLVLVVIVLAGGRLSFTANREGVSADVGSDRLEAAAKGARQATEAAAETAEDLEARAASQSEPDQ